MELVQQVLVQVESSRLGDLRPLLDQLEAHRRDLRGRRGFLGMQITRSTEAGGNVLIDVQSRWRDDASLSDYAGSAESAASIIGRHGAITVAGSLEEKRLEAVEEAPQGGNEVYERFGIALGVPIVIVGLGLAVIYALSRVYLEIDNANAAVFLAAVISMGILLVAWYFASSAVPKWQYTSAAVAVAALLLGGTVYAQVHDGPVRGEAHGEEPTPGGPPPPPGRPQIELNDNFFTVAGSDEHNPQITVEGAGIEVRLDVRNEGAALHNIHIEASPGAGFAASFCTTAGEAPCTDPARVRAGQPASLTFTLPAGSYAYRCDFHTSEMSGTLVIQ